MLKKMLIATATAVALTGAALAPATAATSGYIEVTGPGSWNGPGHSSGPGQWQGHGPKRGAYKHRGPRSSCEPIVRWKKIGFRHHRRWQPIVVGWDCNYGKPQHHWRKH